METDAMQSAPTCGQRFDELMRGFVEMNGIQGWTPGEPSLGLTLCDGSNVDLFGLPGALLMQVDIGPLPDGLLARLDYLDWLLCEGEDLPDGVRPAIDDEGGWAVLRQRLRYAGLTCESLDSALTALLGEAEVLRESDRVAQPSSSGRST